MWNTAYFPLSRCCCHLCLLSLSAKFKTRSLKSVFPFSTHSIGEVVPIFWEQRGCQSPKWFFTFVCSKYFNISLVTSPMTSFLLRTALFSTRTLWDLVSFFLLLVSSLIACILRAYSLPPHCFEFVGACFMTQKWFVLIFCVSLRKCAFSDKVVCKCQLDPVGPLCSVLLCLSWLSAGFVCCWRGMPSPVSTYSELSCVSWQFCVFWNSTHQGMLNLAKLTLSSWGNAPFCVLDKFSFLSFLS